MKHPPERMLTDLCTTLATHAGLEAPADALNALGATLAALWPDAYRLGLTNYGDPQEFTRQLVSPLFPLLTPAAARCVLSPALDFGTGSGALGISLALLRSDCEVVLADRRSRVVQFLDLFLRRLRIENCRTLLVDLGAPPETWQRHCGLVLIRAFGPTDTALRQAVALLRPGGALALWHQPPAPPPPAHLRETLSLPTSVPSLALTIYSD